jgi:arabinogalactan endo-1,4-beta-galactosidase
MKKKLSVKILAIMSVLLLLLTMMSCRSNIEEVADMNIEASQHTRASVLSTSFLQGADLSYVNELQDNGVVYYKNGSVTDPYNLIKEYGGN